MSSGLTPARSNLIFQPSGQRYTSTAGCHKGPLGRRYETSLLMRSINTLFSFGMVPDSHGYGDLLSSRFEDAIDEPIFHCARWTQDEIALDVAIDRIK